MMNGNMSVSDPSTTTSTRSDSTFYIARAIEPDFLAAVSSDAGIVLLKGSQQVGKTSLLIRALDAARSDGCATTVTDVRARSFDADSIVSLYTALANELADQLQLRDAPNETWRVELSPTVNFERYIRRVALDAVADRLVWALDNVDELFPSPFRSEVFGFFRSIHNARMEQPYGPWSRLTLVMTYAREAHLFMLDVEQSPFNVGRRFELTDFVFSEVAELNRRYGEPLGSDAEISRFMRLVGGSPFLAQRGLQQMADEAVNMNALESPKVHNVVYRDHLTRIGNLLKRDEQLSEAVRRVLKGRPPSDPDALDRLLAAGILAGVSASDARPRCQLYASWLERHFL